MRVRLVMAMVALVTFGLRSGWSQTVETLPYDHMHLAAPDQAKAVEWYKAHMGATAGDLPDRVMVGKVIFVWLQRANSPTSEGSVVDHIGFSFPDIDAKIKELTAAGAKLLTPARDVQGLFKLAFIEDPFGTKIELVQDPETPGFHHIHLRLPDPDKALAWYAERFGGERAKLKGRIDGLRYTDGLWLLVQRADGAPPSSGRAIDHLGWRVRDIDATFAAAKTRGDKITAEPRPVRDLRVGFLEDPNGVRIEIAQRPVY